MKRGLISATAILSLLLAPAPRAARAAEPDIIITEIHYHPSSDCEDEEFVEILNRGSERIDLSGFEFIEGIPFKFPAGTFANPGEYLVVARNPQALKAAFGAIPRLYGPWGSWPGGDGQAKLSNDGEDIVLAKPSGEAIHRAEYHDDFPWPLSPDGGGPSLEVIDPELPNDKAGNWRAAGDLGPRWRLYRTTGKAMDSILRLSLSAAGTYLVDDVALGIEGSGGNLVANGGFEEEGGWAFAGNHSGSARVTGEAHTGSAALRIEATGPGSLADAVSQTISGLDLDGPLYTLSFWAKRTEPGVSLAVGFEGRAASFETSQDIGSPSPAGSSSYDPAAGSHTVSGSGADIWGTSDSFHYLHAGLTGDGSIEAEVQWTGTVANDWAKAGLMIRETTSSSSRHAMAILSRDYGVRLQFRSSTAGNSSDMAGPGTPGPVRLGLRRQGNTFIALADTGAGLREYSRTEISMAPSVRIGLMVTSHQNGSIARAIFRGVSSEALGLKIATPSEEEPPAAVATPGAPNTQLSDHVPPYIRKVLRSPQKPRSADPVFIQAKVDSPDGLTAVTSVTLEYQVVPPGHYIRITDPEYHTGWIPAALNDDGLGGDAVAGDGTWTVRLDPRPNRTLVRYRITAIDATGAAARIPYADDESPNFAYFVYDGVPDYVADRRSAQGPLPYRHPAGGLTGFPLYHLIADAGDLDECWYTVTDFNDSTFRWRGTFVHEGEVYDHISYRLRGGVWRYVYPKRYMKLRFLRGHGFEGRDDFGIPYPEKRRMLNLNSVIGNPAAGLGVRGECGIYESLAFQLFRWLRVPSPRTTWVHFRVVRSESESGADQYSGDFFGIYLDVEQPDGRFLDARGLKEGNLYKIEGGWDKEVNGCDPADDSDIRGFVGGLSSAPAWIQANIDLDEYFGYRSGVEMARHYDIDAGKNYYYYHEPGTDLWQVLPWDTDLTFNTNFGSAGAEPWKGPVLDSNPTTFGRDYKNRLREGMDLLYKESALFPVIDWYAALIDTMARADRDRWDDGIIPPFAPLSQRVTELKTWIRNRVSFLNGLSADSAIPKTPAIVSPATGSKLAPRELVFSSSPFSDAAGDTHARSRWIATRTYRNAPFPLLLLANELSPDWDSGPTAADRTSVKIPEEAVDPTPGTIYRVRVRHEDQTGRWSHWSNPVEIEIAEPAERPPEAAIEASALWGRPPLEVTFDGSGSRDPDGDGLTYRWDFGDGQAGTEAAVRHTYPAPGEYAVTLTVDDGRGGTDSESVSVRVGEFFRRGDGNADGASDIADAIGVLFFLFTGGPSLSCERSADIDDSGDLDLSDPIGLLNHLFLEGSAPRDPFRSCGLDPTSDGLPCASFLPCGQGK